MKKLSEKEKDLVIEELRNQNYNLKFKIAMLENEIKNNTTLTLGFPQVKEAAKKDIHNARLAKDNAEKSA